MEKYLSVKNINKYFGDFQALKNVNFDVKEGEFVCILGPSGCGKTTLLRVIAGLESQSEGLINQNNKDISYFLLIKETLELYSSPMLYFQT
jgi:iron(III) transport system ATP-binding protein